MFVTLAPWDQRHRTQMEITTELNRRLQSIPGIQVTAFTANSLGIRGGGQGLQFSLTGNDYDEIGKAADGFIKDIQADPTSARYASTPMPPSRSSRSRSTGRGPADAGVSVEAISSALQTLLQGEDLGNFYIGDDAIEIWVQAPEGMIQDPAGLERIQLHANTGKMVPLSQLVTFEETAVAPTLQRQDQRRAMPMTVTLAEGIDMRTGMDHLDALAKDLPTGIGLVYTGEAKELNKATNGVIVTFAFALLVVVLVLSAQFESFISAFILMATVCPSASPRRSSPCF